MADTRLHDGINWRAFAHVDRYSRDQSRWAEQWLVDNVPHYFTLRPGEKQGQLATALRLTGDPEDGTAEAAGNLLVTVGLARITNLITGGGAQSFNNAQGTVGVGATATAATVSDIALGADAGSAYYQGVDATFPTTSNGVITTQSTFASGNANFAWNEWMWGTGTGTITPGATFASVYSTTHVMLNHKIASLGTKGSGAAWVFTTTVTLS